MKTYDADSIELRIGGKPFRQWRPTDEQRARRHLPNVEFTMRLPVEPDATRLLLGKLLRMERNRRKRERRARRAKR